MISFFEPSHDVATRRLDHQLSINQHFTTANVLSLVSHIPIYHPRDGHRLVNARSHAAAPAHEDRGERRGTDADQP